MILTLFHSPWRLLSTEQDRRSYWRNVALQMIRTGGYWFSIRHLQFMMPNTRRTIWLWGLMHRTPVYCEEVELVDELNEQGDVRPNLHWIGAKPTRESLEGGRRVLLYLHGGGFVLPASSGHITMITTLLKEANASPSTSAYLAIAEYTIAPYAQYPTQLHQIISIIHHLSKTYSLPSSSLILAGDSCGGALALSLLSHYLHPTSSTLPPLPYTLHTSPPLAGILLISPWTSLTTTSESYSTNAASDTLPPEIIRRFRDSYLARSSLLPHTSENPLKVASTTGAHYISHPDPAIPGLKEGVGAIRPPGSVPVHIVEGGQGEDPWWDDINAAVGRVLITAGEYECFRDDIVLCANQLIKAANRGTASGQSAEVELMMDESFHAVVISDFSFPVPTGTLVANLSGWLVDTLRREEAV